MDAADIQSMARLYAGMTPSEIRAHEDWVRRFKAERAEEEARKAKAEAVRSAELLATSAEMAAFHVVTEDYDEPVGPQAVKRLQQAGFYRRFDLNGADPEQPFTHTQAKGDEIVRLSNEITKGRVAEFIGPGGYVERAYRAGFEASGEGWNFEVKGQAVFDDEDFQARLERDFELLLADFEHGASA